MHDLPILRDLFYILAVVVPAALIGHRLRIPPIVIYLFGGICIGPQALGIVHSEKEVHVLAEIGVVLLLFTIGLEFSLQKLIRLRRVVFLSGGLQVVATAAVVWLGGRLMGYSNAWSLAVGCMVALSSTVIVMKTLSEQKQATSPHGKIAIGILLFQDLCLLPMMLLFGVIATLEPGGGGSPLEAITGIGIALAGVVILLAVGVFLLPHLFRLVAATASRELFVLSVLMVVFGTAFAAGQFGISLALGAFVAGMTVSETEYSEQIIADAIPMRDSLSALFFISMGMYIVPQFVFENIGIVLGVALASILLKLLVAMIVIFLSGSNLSTSIVASLSLAQIGEFSLILALRAGTSGLLDNDEYLTIISASVVTMAIAPFLVRYAEQIGYLLDDWFGFASVQLKGKSGRFRMRAADPKPGQAEDELSGKTPSGGHIAIVGFGKIGKYLSHVLRAVGMRYTICEMNGRLFEEMRKEGHPGVFGDAGSSEILEALHIHDASTLVISTGTPRSLDRIIRLARRMNPELYIVVRTRYIAELDDVYEAGANDVVSEEMEASVEIFSLLLRRHHVPRSVVANQMAVIRNEKYGPLMGEKVSRSSFEELESVLAATSVESALITAEGDGQSLLDSRLFEETRLLVLGVLREGNVITSPRPDFTLQERDLVIFVGIHSDIDRGLELLKAKTVR
ncbi:MAG: cation:proton antiporter [bacterium]|nr:cation:proton antiporter [bacterium]